MMFNLEKAVPFFSNSPKVGWPPPGVGCPLLLRIIFHFVTFPWFSVSYGLEGVGSGQTERFWKWGGDQLDLILQRRSRLRGKLISTPQSLVKCHNQHNHQSHWSSHSPSLLLQWLQCNHHPHPHNHCHCSREQSWRLIIHWSFFYWPLARARAAKRIWNLTMHCHSSHHHMCIQCK